jgi:hypothetical protein
MASAADKPEITHKQLAELSALADGSLDPARRPAVQEGIAASRELSALYERERHVVALLHEARAADRAPARLRAPIEAQRPSARVRVRRRVGYGGALVGALAAVALALVLILPAGTPGGPSVSQAAALAIRGAAGPAPASDPSHPGLKLAGGFADVYFPDWARSFGWRAVGQRRDRIDGRLAVTVYYAWQGHRVAYTIVDAPALPVPGAPVTRLRGTSFRTLTLDGRLVVTWRRNNHTCVLSGSGVPGPVLRRLAAWTAPAT